MYYPEVVLQWYVFLICSDLALLIVQIYEDAQAKYAAVRKSISAVIEEAYSILYKSSRPVDEDHPIKEAGKLFAINTLPNYPRQAVVEVPLDIHSGLKTASAQLSKDGKKGMVLLDATDESKPLMASPKGLYADVPRVTGMSASPHLHPPLTP